VAAGSGEEDPQLETYLLRHYEVIFSGLIKGGLAYWIVLQHFDLQSNGRGLPTFKKSSCRHPRNHHQRVYLWV
jgi:hypothetical protein